MIKLLILLPTLLFATFSAQVVDKTDGKPVAHAYISDAVKTVKSDENGSFSIETYDTPVHIKAYGYRPFSLQLPSDETTLQLEPIEVKALYLSFWGARMNSKTMQKVLKIIDETEVNAIVVDVKNEFGQTSYKTEVASANKMGAFYNRTIKNMDAFMQAMQSKNIYMIARIVVFKDDLSAKHRPEIALKDNSGAVWRNQEKLAWVDPYLDTTHRYNLDIAEDAARAGFDEVNFDYIRFPAKADLCYAQEHTPENRIRAISNFLANAKQRLRPHGTFISVNTYGYVCWNKDDTNIGHTVASLAEHADYLSPMLYPSGFNSGALGFEDPTEHSYDIIYRSILRMHRNVDPVRVRPWLQSFKDYAHGRKHFKQDRIMEQICASNDANTSGWMLWNPSSRYKYIPEELYSKPEQVEMRTALKEIPATGTYFYNHCNIK